MKQDSKEKLLQEICFMDEEFKISLQNKQSNRSERAFHEAIEIKLFYEGRAMQMIGQRVIISEAGDLTVTNPYEVHTNMETDLYDGKYYLLTVDLDFPISANPKGMDLRHLLLSRRQAFVNHIRGDRYLEELVLRVVRELECKEEYYRIAVSDLLNEFFIHLLRHYVDREKSGRALSGATRRSNLIAPALSKIFSDYDKHITIDELAELCHISPYYFCRVFREEMGVTAIQYLTRYRISLAEAMLTEGGKSMEEIAYRCGFDDISYFYRCYKKIKGIAPKKR